MWVLDLVMRNFKSSLEDACWGLAIISYKSNPGMKFLDYVFPSIIIVQEYIFFTVGLVSVEQNLIHLVVLNLSCSELNQTFFGLILSLYISTAPAMPVRFHLYPLALSSCDEREACSAKKKSKWKRYVPSGNRSHNHSLRKRTPSNAQPPHPL